jgi:hypothetical protein
MSLMSSVRATALAAALVGSSIAAAQAAPVSSNVSGTFNFASGTLAGALGLAFTSGFNYDTDTSTRITSPVESLEFDTPVGGGQRLGVEYAAGSVTPSVPAISAGYTSPTSVLEIDNNVFFDSSELLGLFPSGVYDLFTVNGWEPSSTFGSAASTINDNDAIDAFNFGLAFIGDLVAGPLTTGSDMPGTLNLANIIGVVVVAEEYVGGELVGIAYSVGQIDGTFNEFTIVSDEPSVPVPAAGLLMLAGVAGMAGLRRRSRG